MGVLAKGVSAESCQCHAEDHKECPKTLDPAVHWALRAPQPGETHIFAKTPSKNRLLLVAENDRSLGVAPVLLWLKSCWAFLLGWSAKGKPGCLHPSACLLRARSLPGWDDQRLPPSIDRRRAKYGLGEYGFKRRTQ